MIVKELIEILSKVDGEMKIMSTWEGTVGDIDAIFVDDKTVLFDVDDGYYIRNEVERHPESMKNVLYMADNEEELK